MYEVVLMSAETGTTTLAGMLTNVTSILTSAIGWGGTIGTTII